MRRPVAMLALVVMVASLAAAFPAATFAASPTSTPTVATNHGALPPWVVKASPFVHVSNGIATIDPAASRSLDSTTYGLTVKAVAHYNALPAIEKQTPLPVMGVVGAGGQVNTVQPMMINLQACVSGSYVEFNWWGTHLKFSECLTQYLGNSSLDLGGVVAVIGLIPWAAPVALPAGIIIIALGGVVLWVDMTFCDYHGVALNIPVIGLVNIGC